MLLRSDAPVNGPGSANYFWYSGGAIPPPEIAHANHRGRACGTHPAGILKRCLRQEKRGPLAMAALG